MSKIFLSLFFILLSSNLMANNKKIKFIIESTPEHSINFYILNNSKKEVQLPKISSGYGHFYSGTEPHIYLKGKTKIDGVWRELNFFHRIRCATFSKLKSLGKGIQPNEKVKIGSFFTSIEDWFLFDEDTKEIKITATYNLGVTSQGTALGIKDFVLKSNTLTVVPKKVHVNYSIMMYYYFKNKLNKKEFIDKSIIIKKEKLECADETLERGLLLHKTKIPPYTIVFKSSEYVYFDKLKGKSVRFLLLESGKNNYLACWTKKGNYKGHFGEYYFYLKKLPKSWKYK